MSAPCVECGRINQTSPSDYFCSDLCQQHWYTRRTIGYAPEREAPVPAHIEAAVGRWRAA